MKIPANATLTPIDGAPQCSIAENKYIDRSQESNSAALGRQLMYIPTLIFSVVLSSVRTPKKTRPTEPRLSKEEMDEVCVRLSKLFVEDGEGAKTEGRDDSEGSMECRDDAQDEVTEPPCDKRCDEANVKEVLGRVERKVISYKHSKVNQVLRSSRLEAKRGVAH